MEKRRIQGDLSVAFQYLREAYKQRETEFLHTSIVIRGEWLLIKSGGFRLDIKKKLFTWKGLSREHVGAPITGNVQGWAG